MRVLIVLAALCAFTYGYGNRIIDGEDANIEDIPYQAAVLKYNSQTCGASIIAANWILTAAHCVRGVNVNALAVRVGSSVWNNGGSLHQVNRTVIHPKISTSNIRFDYDYALIELTTPVPLGQPGVAAIEIAEDTPEDGDMARVSGWGIDYNRILQLKTVTLPIVSREECRRSYGCEDISERMICAGWRFGGNNTCNGDSGGPLVVDGRQVGLVSWAMGCAWPEFPTVFADVINQRRWILRTIGQL